MHKSIDISTLGSTSTPMMIACDGFQQMNHSLYGHGTVWIEKENYNFHVIDDYRNVLVF